MLCLGTKGTVHVITPAPSQRSVTLRYRALLYSVLTLLCNSQLSATALTDLRSVTTCLAQ